MRVLVAEDDIRLAALLADSLREAGWQVETVHDGRTALQTLLGDASIDVALLDRMLPHLDGLAVARRLRELGVTVPVLMLTALGEVRDRIDGLDAGADDYLPKPFDLDELLARLRALHRRGTTGAEGPVQVGDLLVAPVARRVVRAGTAIAVERARRPDWPSAVRAAKSYLTAALGAADELVIGGTGTAPAPYRGHGPVHHGAARPDLPPPQPRVVGSTPSRVTSM